MQIVQIMKDYRSSDLELLCLIKWLLLKQNFEDTSHYPLDTVSGNYFALAKYAIYILQAKNNTLLHNAYLTSRQPQQQLL